MITPMINESLSNDYTNTTDKLDNDDFILCHFAAAAAAAA